MIPQLVPIRKVLIAASDVCNRSKAIDSIIPRN